MLHKTQKVLSGASFYDLPEYIIPAVNGNISINVSGNGLIKGTSGKRWWDSNLLADNGVIAGTKDVPIQLPFVNTFLYSGMVDLICEVTIDGTKYIYAASNSPDNVVTTAAPSNASVYYLDLLCAGLSNTVGNSNSANHFMQGGRPTAGEALGTANGQTGQARIYFSETTQSAGVFNITADYVSYNNSTPSIPAFTKSVSYGLGINAIDAFVMKDLFLHYFNAASYFTHQNAGFYKIQVINPNPAYRSALNYYHYGQSN